MFKKYINEAFDFNKLAKPKLNAPLLEGDIELALMRSALYRYNADNDIIQNIKYLPENNIKIDDKIFHVFKLADTPMYFSNKVNLLKFKEVNLGRNSNYTKKMHWKKQYSIEDKHTIKLLKYLHDNKELYYYINIDTCFISNDYGIIIFTHVPYQDDNKIYAIYTGIVDYIASITDEEKELAKQCILEYSKIYDEFNTAYRIYTEKKYEYEHALEKYEKLQISLQRFIFNNQQYNKLITKDEYESFHNINTSTSFINFIKQKYGL